MVDLPHTLAAGVAEGLSEQQMEPSLKVVVDYTVPRDELHVHPSMFALMQQAVIEDQLWRTVRALVAKERGDE